MIVVDGTESASSSPLRSKITPRLACSTRSLVRCARPASRSSSASAVCSMTTRAMTMLKTIAVTMNTASNRRRVWPALK